MCEMQLPNNNRPCNVPVEFSDLGIKPPSYKLWCYLIELSLAPATCILYDVFSEINYYYYCSPNCVYLNHSKGGVTLESVGRWLYQYFTRSI